jgi:flagellar biosynthesis/type III secretory pathway chaperone
MDPRQRIAAILKQWLEMTHAESQAIQSGDWPALRRVQAAKAELRLPLGQAVEQWRAENPAQAAAQPFRDEVTQLLALETQNGSLLAARKHRAHEKKRLLEQALFNLRRVRSTYTKPERMVLDSYS